MPETVHSRLRASRAARREALAAAGRPFSQAVMSSLISDSSKRLPNCGRRNSRIKYSRLYSVLGPTSWTVAPAIELQALGYTVTLEPAA